jgi:hypothetical protein
MAAFKAFKFNPLRELDVDIPRANREAALKEAAEYLREQLLDFAGQGRSIVSGGRWVKTLSKDYAAEKGESSSVNYADLNLSGHLLDGLSVDVSGNNIVIDVDSADYGKAEGHLTGEYGKSTKIKPRQFMPQQGQTFKAAILSELKKILAEHED